METGADRRKRKLSELVGRYGLKLLARDSGLNPATIDQVLKGTLLPPRADGTRKPKQLGDDAARAIEKAFKLPEGWFDAETEVNGLRLSEEAIKLALQYERLNSTERLRLHRILEAVIETVPHVELGGLDSGLGLFDDESTGTNNK